MAARTLYFDESGFTGSNLLDSAQPIFAIASAEIEPAMAETILRRSFPNYQGAEFKFANIWGSNNKIGLVEFGRQIGEVSDRAFTWMIDKRFAVLTKIVDFLIEPTVTNAGYDFYSDGFCWKYTNYIYFGLTQLAAPELLDSLLTAYQIFSRDPSPNALDRLHTLLKIMSRSCEADVQIFFEQMALGAEVFERFHNLDAFKGSNELHMTSMLAIIAHWRKIYSEDFIAIHDASANFFRQREVWEKITNNNVPAQEHSLGDGTLVQFPLRVISTTPVDSKDSYAIQLCDILAGLTTRQFNTRVVGDDRELLSNAIGAGLGAVTYNGIRPDTVFPDHIPPKKLEGPDVVDRMTQIIFGPHNKQP